MTRTTAAMATCAVNRLAYCSLVGRHTMASMDAKDWTFGRGGAVT